MNLFGGQMRRSGVFDDALGTSEVTNVMNQAVDDDVGIAAGRPGLGSLFLCNDI
ncbi:MAG: hypothetical protein KJO09_14530 [Gammaproteobacteria bacterium]|nr:hypothetical protein [Gammaproteobacteria bacterium]